MDSTQKRPLDAMDEDSKKATKTVMKINKIVCLPSQETCFEIVFPKGVVYLQYEENEDLKPVPSLTVSMNLLPKIIEVLGISSEKSE